MNSHVSSILLGVNDMERSKRFYGEGLGWKVQNDYKISVFFFPTAARWSASTAATGSPTWWA
jgi:predicted enzyme related to lactoylglutathione lyase